MLDASTELPCGLVCPLLLPDVPVTWHLGVVGGGEGERRRRRRERKRMDGVQNPPKIKKKKTSCKRAARTLFTVGD